MSGEKPWDRSRPKIPGTPTRVGPGGQSSEDLRKNRTEPLGRMPGGYVPREPVRQVPTQSGAQKRNSSIKGIIAVASVLLVSGIAVIANSSSNGDGGGVTSSSPANIVTPTSFPKNSADSSLTQWEELSRSVVYIEAAGASCGWAGSGSIVLDGSYVLTNHHVAGDGECDLRVGFTDSTDSEPTTFVNATVLISDAAIDLAVIRLIGQDGQPYSSPQHRPLVIDYANLKLGDKIYTLGYPGVGGATVTLTSGDYSGMEHSDTDFYKTTANMNPGVSGGSALSINGKLIGVPTAGVLDPESKQRVGLNLIRPISFAKQFLDKVSTMGLSVDTVDPVSDQESISSEESSADPIYGTCREAKSHGYGPYYEGSDYEYDYYDDRDNDGIVCE